MVDTKTVAASIGGAVLSTQNGYNVAYALGLVDLARRHGSIRFLYTCGGGWDARLRRDAAIAAGVKDKVVLDELGMEITRHNALMLSRIMQANGINAAPLIPRSFDQFKETLKGNFQVVVCGGFIEGLTTDTDAVLTVEWAGQKVMFNISGGAYVHDKDPKKFPGQTTPLPYLTYEQLIAIANENDKRDPGSNVIFDSVASKLVSRSGIEVRFVDGSIAPNGRLESFEEAIDMAERGLEHHGTTASHTMPVSRGLHVEKAVQEVTQPQA